MKGEQACCRIDAVVTIDSKGQIVLPKDIREKAKLKPDGKLALIGCERGGEICCLVMVKAERLGRSVSSVLGPLLKDVMEQGGAKE
jgi:AbrB family looped-hinge helix DNA binding protein